MSCGPQYGQITPDMRKFMNQHNAPLLITGVSLSSSNSVGGRDVIMNLEITSEKTIKYIFPSFSAYNEVNDKINCTIRDYNIFEGKATGPYNKESKKSVFYWENAYYNWSAHCVELVEVTIEYVDGTIDKYSTSDEISKLYAPQEFQRTVGIGCNF